MEKHTVDLPASYVWLAHQEDDSYAWFADSFTYTQGRAELSITAENQFAAYVNGELAANSQYADLPEYKAVSRYDITALCRKGSNTLTVLAYHPGQEWSQSRKMTACVRYAVTAEKTLLAASSAKTQCRQAVSYSPGDIITGQLGLGYGYDFTAEEKPWENATVVEPGFTCVPKPIANTYLTDRPARLLQTGPYRENGGHTAAELVYGALLEQEGTGQYFLLDLGGESAGYPYFSLTCEEKTAAYLGWGEHLADGRIRTAISGRNFTVPITLRAGRNDFSDYLRRIGCRYLCLFVESQKSVKLHGAGLWEERYPLKKPPVDLGKDIYNALFETGRRTLELCMHQHYEDCPWREQALYGMDSRNQMLFGYYAFREYHFPRANLELMARCIEADGLLPLCPPSRNTITIPSFSAYWVLAVYENACADYREDFVKGMLPYIRKVIDTFRSYTRDGAVHTLPETRYWNFHEWSEGLDGGAIFRDYEIASVPDAALSAICCRAAAAAAALENMVGSREAGEQYDAYARELADGFVQFYVPEMQAFASYIREGRPEGFHQLTQALLLSTGYLTGEAGACAVRALQNGEALVPITLSGMVLKYEALLQHADALDYVLEDLVRVFSPMLQGESGTYWETALGQQDFENAGSLCHGWSAVACYVLGRLKFGRIGDRK